MSCLLKREPEVPTLIVRQESYLDGYILPEYNPGMLPRAAFPSNQPPVPVRSLATAILFDGSLVLEWEEGDLPLHPERQKLERRLLDEERAHAESVPYRWLLILGLSGEQTLLSPALSFWRELVRSWLHQIRTLPDIEEKRQTVELPLEADEAEHFLRRLPSMVGVDSLNCAWIQKLWAGLTAYFRQEMASFSGSVEDYFSTMAPTPLHVDRIHFHLVENRGDDVRPFAFLATYTVRIDDRQRVRHQPLRLALQEFADHQEKLLELLSTVNRVAKTNKWIASLIDSGELFHPVRLTPQEAFAFLSGVTDFESAGILCRIPRWWKGGPRRATVTLSVGNREPSRLGYDALLDFQAGLMLDEEPISEAEARRILEQAEGLALIKGKWVAVDQESLRRTLEAMKQARRLAASEELSFADTMRLLMGSKTEKKARLFSEAEVTCGQWLKSVLERMVNPTLTRDVSPSPGLRAELRPYQQQGLNWLSFLQGLGFGLCLADDMGLGKTVQMLAHLQNLKREGRTSLIVVPASLLENWRQEIEKFTPDMTAVIVHPQMIDAETFGRLEKNIRKYDLAITTYGMLSRCPWLSSCRWFYIVCDEAQAIKNPSTRQTRAVKALQGDHRAVMTGTPVENRLTDLWSLFDFINPGLLGSFAEFKAFSKTLDDRPDGYGRLRRVVHPYILRRSKSDPTILHDLPDKVEMKAWCTLSRQQTILYENLVRRLRDEIAGLSGIQRKGLVLSCLMKCKQLCNHPDHYAGEGGYTPEASGKFQRLAELCAAIHEKREKVLIFTQFTEIIDPLASFLEQVFQAPGLTLSGATSVRKRREAVDLFQNRTGYIPFFLLSLKAGGVGLNLTAANHVIHFDRWWNPAVENQATDRAFRIGQKRNVMVHKFICRGTVEEKIDRLIEDKKELAKEIIPSAAENWITEMNDDQIRDLFRLTVREGMD